MNKVFLGLGSNVGNRSEMIVKAISQLEEHPEIVLEKQSAIYETKPFGYTDQPDFLNMVIEISTSLEPMELLSYINKVEYKNGREREIHWGPRTIDIDILLIDDIIIKNKDLQVPHPYMKERLFVLIPLAEIYSGKIPGESITIEQLIQRLDQSKGEVKVWEI